MRIAVALGRPVINGIKEIWFDDGRRTAFARREAPGGGWETYELPLPAILGVKEGLNLPRYPSVPGRLRAKKKEVERVALGASPSGALGLGAGEDAAGRRRRRARARRSSACGCPRRSGPRPRSSGRAPDAAPAVVDLLERIGVLSR